MIDNEATLIATTFEWADQIDLERAKRAKEVAQARISAAKNDKRELMLAEAKLQRALGAHQRQALTAKEHRRGVGCHACFFALTGLAMAQLEGVGQSAPFGLRRLPPMGFYAIIISCRGLCRFLRDRPHESKENGRSVLRQG